MYGALLLCETYRFRMRSITGVSSLMGLQRGSRAVLPQLHRAKRKMRNEFDGFMTIDESSSRRAGEQEYVIGPTSGLINQSTSSLSAVRCAQFTVQVAGCRCVQAQVYSVISSRLRQ